jgi:N-acetylneuraminate synthase
LTDDDVYLAVPLLKGQLSCRELIAGEALAVSLLADAPLSIDSLDNPYSRTMQLREQIQNRGL